MLMGGVGGVDEGILFVSTRAEVRDLWKDIVVHEITTIDMGNTRGFEDAA